MSPHARDRIQLMAGIVLLVVAAATLVWVLVLRSPSDVYVPATTTTCYTGACS